ncbi:hypothetical protein PINS_up001980 [Pythium insidiosum]|nr:hypothetical protein PINS_up001980 [Pythium insidiosum]
MEARIPGFVSTTVLTSSDGLFGENTEEKRVADAPAPRAEDAADYKPLYERLQEMKDQKEREWKEKNNPFAPPKALDDEEVSFIRELEERQATQDQQRKAQQQEDLAEFILARESVKAMPKNSNASTPLTGPSLIDVAAKKLARGDIKTTAPANIVVKAKRKVTSKSKSDEDRVEKKAKTEEPTKAPVVVKATSQAKASLVAYGSDSDDSD